MYVVALVKHHFCLSLLCVRHRPTPSILNLISAVVQSSTSRGRTAVPDSDHYYLLSVITAAQNQGTLFSTILSKPDIGFVCMS